MLLINVRLKPLSCLHLAEVEVVRRNIQWREEVCFSLATSTQVALYIPLFLHARDKEWVGLLDLTVREASPF